MTTTHTTIQVGAFVHYHGSIARVHGLWQVVTVHADSLNLDCGEWGRLYGVRPESITECGNDCERCAAYNANH